MRTRQVGRKSSKNGSPAQDSTAPKTSEVETRTEPQKPQPVTVGVELPGDLFAAVEKCAKECRQSPAQLIAESIAEEFVVGAEHSAASVPTGAAAVTLAVLSGPGLSIEDEIEIPAKHFEMIKRRAACMAMTPRDYIREMMFRQEGLLSEAVTVALSIDGEPINSFTLSIPMSGTLRHIARTEHKELAEVFAEAIDLYTRGKCVYDPIDHLSQFHVERGHAEL